MPRPAPGAMNRFRQIVREAHRRSLWQVLAVYVLGSYVALEVIGNLNDVFGLPAWVPAGALILFIVGLPVVLATAFVQESGPDRSDLAPRPADAMPGYETATDTAFETASETAPRPSEVPSDSFLEQHLTWRRAILGGVAAFLLLTFVTAGYMGLRQSGIGPFGTLLARGVMNESDRVLLADFTAPAGDSLVASAVTEALRIDLEKSDVVRVVEPMSVRRVLDLMGREPGSVIDGDLAREIALRDGIEAVLVGSVNPLGAAYVLTARLVAAGDGSVLASFRETAEDAADVVDAVDRLSADLRERVGESLRSIRESPPLERVTTPSLPALEKYSQAVRIMAAEPESERATALLEEAVALDTTFAMAYRLLAASYSMTAHPLEQVEGAVRAAYRHRDRLTERERQMATADYLVRVRDDLPAAAEVLERTTADNPEDPLAHRMMAHVLMRSGRERQAEAYARRAVALDSLDALNHDELVTALAEQGRFEEARAALEREMRLFPADSLWHLRQLANFAYQEGDLERVDELLRRISDHATSERWRATATAGLGFLALLQGKVRQAQQSLQQSIRMVPWANEYRDVWSAVSMAQIAWLHGVDAAPALSRLENVLDSPAADRLPAGEGRELHIAGTLARVERPAEARRWLRSWQERADEDEQVRFRDEYLGASARIAMAEGDPQRAVSLIRERRELPDACPACDVDELAEAYVQAGTADSATKYYRVFLEHPRLWRLEDDAFDRAPALRWLARYHDERGADSVAIRYYAELVDLWSDADPELQPQVESARRRIAALAAERRP